MADNPKTLDGFLTKYKSIEGTPITHTKIGDVKLGIYGGSYSIPDQLSQHFFTLYQKEVLIGKKKSYLTEVQLPEKGPVLVDIDERYSKSITERQHTDEHILDIIGLYIDKLKELIKEEQLADFNIPVFVMQKDKINVTDDCVKDGIHLIFGLTMSHACQMVLRDHVIEEIGDIYGDLPLINSYEQLIDIGISRGKTNWQLYGSCKPGHDEYKLTTIYNITLDADEYPEFQIDEIPKKISPSFLTQLSARNTSFQELELTDKAKEEEANKNKKVRVKKKTPVTVANTTLKTMVSCMNAFPAIQTAEQCEMVMNKILELAEIQDHYHIIMAYKFAMILNEAYYDPYDMWMKVGWTLKSISPLLYPCWLLHSAKSTKFDWISNDCHKLWEENMGRPGNTMGSLRYWAKECNLTAYEKIKKGSIDYYLFRTLDGETEYDVAKLVYTIYEGQYKCCNIRNKLWYEYKKGRWSEIDSGTTLRNALSSRISKIYHVKVKDTLSSLDDNGPDAAESEAVKNMRMNADKLSKMALKLKKTAWKQNIMRECCEVFFDKDFMNLLDTNTELICFKNGVLDIATKEFREGKPDDYLSLCTHTDYIPIDHSDPEHMRIRAEVLLFFQQLFPNPNVNKYMWEHLASVLRGDNRNQTFNIYTGSGRNGKSKLVELMSLVLGDYKGSVPLALITQKRGSIGGVSPEIAQLKGLRYAVMQEPSKATKLNEGIMKELTGGDPIQGRALFKDTVTFVPQFSLAVCTNHLFDITSSDDGTWRRIRVCDFVSRFVDNPSEDPNDYEFQVDRNIDKKFKEWAPIFTAMLVEKLFETNGMVADCPEVMASSQNYKAQQDYFTGFMKERIVKLESGRIKKTDVLHEFQEWYSELYGGKVPSGKELYDFLEKKLGRAGRTGWKGWNLYHSWDMQDDDDIEPNGI